MTIENDLIKIDCEKEVNRIVSAMRDKVREFRRTGAIVGISGGIDSSVSAALSVRAFGAEKVIGIVMPEKESSPDSMTLAVDLAKNLGISFVVEDITPILESARVYEKRDSAIRDLIPQYSDEWTCKIVLSQDLLEKSRLNIFHVVVESPGGERISRRLPVKHYLEIVASSNYKQRSRMMTLYYHAERNNYAVIGTGNKNECELGFYVKYGDGGVDIQPISCFFKTQVFQLGKYLGIPSEILTRTPTTDTYSAEVSQTDFFYKLDFDKLDTIWSALNKGISIPEIASASQLSIKQVENIRDDIIQKTRSTEYIRANPVII